MAARFFVNGGVNNNWSATSNWSLTSGGSGGQAVPLATDDVHFDANSPNCTVDASARVALTLDFTGYVNTITMTNGVTVSGNVTFSAGMTISGTGGLTVNATATLTSNGKTWPNPLTFSGTLTATLSGILTVSGTLNLGASGNSAALVLSGSTINVGGGLLFNGAGGTVSGTANIVLNGTGTVSAPNVTTGRLTNNLEINTAGNITFSGVFQYAIGTFKYTAGTVVTTGATFRTVNSAATITANASGLNFDTLDFQIATTCNGTNGFTVGTFKSSANLIHSLKSGNTYAVNTTFSFPGGKATPITLAASTPSSSTLLNISASATQEVSYVNATDIDGSGGAAVYDFAGTLIRTTNWNQLTSVPRGLGAFTGGRLR